MWCLAVAQVAPHRRQFGVVFEAHADFLSSAGVVLQHSVGRARECDWSAQIFRQSYFLYLLY